MIRLVRLRGPRQRAPADALRDGTNPQARAAAALDPRPMPLCLARGSRGVAGMLAGAEPLHELARVYR